MSYKRKYISKDEYIEPQTPRKRKRRVTREAVVATNDDDIDYHSTARSSRRSHRPAAPLSRAEKKAIRLTAELTNLADYNKPPEISESDTQRDSASRTSRRTRNVAASTEKLRVQGARITKPTVPRPQKRSDGDRLLVEVARLTPWS
jgi:hypothetical protein